MAYYEQNPKDYSSNLQNFSMTQVRALSNGIGIGQTRQRKMGLDRKTPTQDPQVQAFHRSGYAEAYEEQQLPQQQARSWLFKVHRLLFAAALDLTVVASLIAFSIMFAIALSNGVSSLSVVSIKGIASSALAWLLQLRLMEISAITSGIILSYFLGFRLLLGSTVGGRLFLRKF